MAKNSKNSKPLKKTNYFRKFIAQIYSITLILFNNYSEKHTNTSNTTQKSHFDRFLFHYAFRSFDFLIVNVDKNLGCIHQHWKQEQESEENLKKSKSKSNYSSDDKLKKSAHI